MNYHITAGLRKTILSQKLDFGSNIQVVFYSLFLEVFTEVESPNKESNFFYFNPVIGFISADP